MLVNKNINNLSGGVSQQPDANRFDNQVELMENCLVTEAQGLRRRNPTRLLDTTEFTNSNNTAIHSYSRGDGTKKYGILLDTNGIQVYSPDEAGTAGFQKTVNVVGTNPITQWGAIDYRNDIQFLTVGDTTWVLNKKQEVDSSIVAEVVNENKAFYWIKKTTSIAFGTSANEFKGYEYEVVLDGVSYSAYDAVSLGEAGPVYDTSDSIATLVSMSTLINNDSHNTRMFAKSSGSIMMIVKGDFTSKAEDIYVSIVTAHENSNSIAISDDVSGSNPIYYNMTIATDRVNALGRVASGAYINCVAGWKRILHEFSTYTSPTTGADGYWDSVNYYNDSNQGLSHSLDVSIQHYENSNEFTFESGDGFGNQASTGWRDSVAKLSDLPSAMDGFTEEEAGTIAITGTDKDSYTNYYIRWQDKAWKEVNRPGARTKIDANTMPAKLIQIDDENFEFGFLRQSNDETTRFSYGDDIWEDRLKGDEDSNPTPSFIGSTISNMFFFKNRLGFTSGENVILSETANYYTFFATTAMEVLDSDPIDASVDSNTVAIIRSVTVTSGAVTLWADDAQFLLAGAETLSPATTRISQTSSYACDSSIEPIAVDNEILFFNKQGEYLEVMTYAAATLQADKSSAASITSHIPEYLHSTVQTATVSKSHNLVFLFSTDEPRELYVYKYYNKGQEKVISAWSEWTFNEDIKGIEVLEDKLFLLAGTNDVLYIDLEPMVLADNFRDRESIAYESKVIMSKFNIQTRQDTKVISEPFYMKTLSVQREGNVNMDIINSERNRTTTVDTKHLDRKLFIGGNSNHINIGFSTSANTGCEIDVLNIEGRITPKSRNI